MVSREDLQARFQLVFQPESYRRVIAGNEVVIHCHHYNARLQHLIEGTKQIDGREIFLSGAEEVFAEHIRSAIRPEDSLEEKWQVAAGLYSHLGYGLLDLSQLGDGVITAPSSHFVEGWHAGFKEVDRSVCTLTEGYLQGAIHAITGETVHVREEECMATGADRCRFVIDRSRTTPFTSYLKHPVTFVPRKGGDFLTSPNVDEQAIIDALVGMPIYGNDEGLIPAFSVYLANTPSAFYNSISARFVEEMRKQGLLSTAKKLLVFAGEVCALNTLRGIMNSPEWDGLVAPMVKEEADNLHGLIAITNGLGWGNWHIRAHEPGELLQLESLNCYEGVGYLRYIGSAHDPQCYGLTGVTAGIMALIYSEGTVEERLGTYYSEEQNCICTEDQSCLFEAEVL